jgi:hypothetical protein
MACKIGVMISRIKISIDNDLMSQSCFIEEHTAHAKHVICTRCRKRWTLTVPVAHSFVCQTCLRDQPMSADERQERQHAVDDSLD